MHRCTGHRRIKRGIWDGSIERAARNEVGIRKNFTALRCRNAELTLDFLWKWSNMKTCLLHSRKNYIAI